MRTILAVLLITVSIPAHAQFKERQRQAEEDRLRQTIQEELDYRRGMVPMVPVWTRRGGQWVDQNGYNGIPDGYVGDEP